MLSVSTDIETLYRLESAGFFNPAGAVWTQNKTQV